MCFSSDAFDTDTFSVCYLNQKEGYLILYSLSSDMSK